MPTTCCPSGQKYEVLKQMADIEVNPANLSTCRREIWIRPIRTSEKAKVRPYLLARLKFPSKYAQVGQVQIIFSQFFWLHVFGRMAQPPAYWVTLMQTEMNLKLHFPQDVVILCTLWLITQTSINACTVRACLSSQRKEWFLVPQKWLPIHPDWKVIPYQMQVWEFFFFIRLFHLARWL